MTQIIIYTETKLMRIKLCKMTNIQLIQIQYQVKNG